MHHLFGFVGSAETFLLYARTDFHLSCCDVFFRLIIVRHSRLHFVLSISPASSL